MKKTLLIIFVLMVSVLTLTAGEEIYGDLGINLLLPSDSNYKEIYGNSVIMPDVEIGYMINDKINIYGGFGYISKSGTTEGELKVDTKSTRTYLDLGIGYGIYKGDNLLIKIKGGISYIMSKEDAMEEDVNSNTLGFKAELEGDYKINDKLFTGLKIDYIYGKDRVEDVDIRLGGVKIGVVLGYRF